MTKKKLSSYREQVQIVLSELPKRLEENKAKIMAALSELHVASVQVTWSGGGDSGGVESIQALDDEEKTVSIKDKKIIVTLEHSEYNPKTRKTKLVRTEKELDLTEAIDYFCMDWVDHKGSSGWYNDDGGFGNATFDVESRAISINHSNNEIVAHSIGSETV